MDRVENDLYELCTDFLLLLDSLKETEKISEAEYELHVKLKKLFIHQEKSKLSV
ncbi:hypothetical protein [Schnuerera sp.]|uniref:hypothetical protein n=1 Tax=Schnuerera sp. TaxID=2794844 RepID=UPI002C67805C|nr:hypothetical protein [Schnuerera sp.]HSH35190.1 hypothetical protein [Schnuerera sp.]